MFLLLKGDLEGRFDPKYAIRERFIAKYPKQKLGDLLREKPMYGANESAVEANRYKDIRYLRITDIDEFGNLKDTDWKTAQKVDEKYLLNPNDIVFARTGATAGKALIFRREMPKSIFAGYLIKFVVDSDKVNPEYIFYYTQTNVYQSWVNSIQRPSGQPNINSEEFKSLEIPIPDDITQQTIINIFEQAYATKKANEAQAKALLASIDDYLLKELGITLPNKQENSLKNRVFLRNISEVGGGRFDGYYYGEFFERFHTALAEGNYPISQLESLCSKITDGTHYTPTYVQEGVKFISVKNVRRSKISFDDVKYITQEEHLTLTKRAKPEPNDILLTKIGTIGLACVIEEGLPEFSIFVSLALLKPTDTINPYFLSEVINSPIVSNQFERDLKGTGVPDLHLENIRKVSIPLPPLEIQEKIVIEIQKIREQAQKLQNEAKAVLEQAKIKVEKMILEGGEND